VVIFSTDHGSTLGSHGLQDKGLNMYDDVYRIPMIISGPMVARQGAVVERIVSHTDLSPTFIDLAGGKVPEGYDGSPLTPYVEGDLKHTIRKEMVMEGFGHQVPFLQRSIRDLRFKYIYNTTAIDEFYDIRNDPHETLNLIDTAEPRLLRRYQKKLQEWMEANGDPLRKWFAQMTFTESYGVRK